MADDAQACDAAGVAKAHRRAPKFQSLGWRVGNAIATAFARVGIGPIYLVTTTGRNTGRRYTNPVVPIEGDGRLWLVAPYGAVAWVRNARAAGRVSLRRGRHERECAIREVGASEAGPVLKRYLGIANRTRASFQAKTDSPVEEFVAEADRHPVFELTPLSTDA
jgi:deazaflavin-dependent oxidoreductase (nitroreductase family)